MTATQITERSKHLCLLCLTSLLACACSAEPDVPVDDVRVPLHIGSVALEAETADTRTATTQLTSGEIGIFLKQNGTNTDHASNRKYKLTGGTWTSEETTYVSSKPSAIAAYYPYNAGIKDWQLPLTAQVYAADKDLVYECSRTVDASAPTINFRMKHAYGRFKILIKRGTYDGTGSVTNVELHNYMQSSVFNLNTNKPGNQNGQNGKNVQKIVSITAGPEPQELADFLLPPCIQGYTIGPTINPGQIKCTIDGEVFSVNLKDSFLPEAGVCKTVTVTLNGKALQLGTMGIYDWQTDTPGTVTPDWPSPAL